MVNEIKHPNYYHKQSYTMFEINFFHVKDSFELLSRSKSIRPFHRPESKDVAYAVKDRTSPLIFAPWSYSKYRYSHVNSSTRLVSQKLQSYVWPSLHEMHLIKLADILKTVSTTESLSSSLLISSNAIIILQDWPKRIQFHVPYLFVVKWNFICFLNCNRYIKFPSLACSNLLFSPVC